MRWLMLLAVMAVVGCGPGEEGPAGPAGPAGPQGAKGAPGPGINETKHILCSGFFDMTGTGAGVYLSHDAWNFPDGSVITTCSVGNRAAETSTFFMYRAEQNGAVAAQCVLRFDVDTPSAGFWKFAIAANRTWTKAEYSDAGSPYNTRSISLDCQAL